MTTRKCLGIVKAVARTSKKAKVSKQRLNTLILLIAIAYISAIIQGGKSRDWVYRSISVV